MKNSIADRVSDFLKKYPPFNMIDDTKLLEVSSKVTITYLEKGNTIYKQGDTFNDHFYIVRDGAITLYHNNNNIEKY